MSRAVLESGYFQELISRAVLEAEYVLVLISRAVIEAEYVLVLISRAVIVLIITGSYCVLRRKKKIFL